MAVAEGMKYFVADTIGKTKELWEDKETMIMEWSCEIPFVTETEKEERERRGEQKRDDALGFIDQGSELEHFRIPPSYTENSIIGTQGSTVFQASGPDYRKICCSRLQVLSGRRGLLRYAA